MVHWNYNRATVALEDSSHPTCFSRLQISPVPRTVSLPEATLRSESSSRLLRGEGYGQARCTSDHPMLSPFEPFRHSPTSHGPRQHRVSSVDDLLQAEQQ